MVLYRRTKLSSAAPAKGVFFLWGSPLIGGKHG